MTSYSLPRSSPFRPLAINAVVTAGATIVLWLGSELLPSVGTRVAAPHANELALALHIVAAVAAVPLGGYVLWTRKGTARHKLLGRIWAALMLVVAVSSYWLRTITGGFSFIHLFAVLTLVSIPLGIFYARQGRIQDHLSTMRGLYVGLVIAGAFAFVPGRVIGTALFG